MFENVNSNHKKRQGNIGETRAIYEYTRLGYSVFIPVSDINKYDLIIDDGNGLKRVQVKTASYQPKRKNPTEVFCVNLKTTSGNKNKTSIRYRQQEDYDIIFILSKNGECWSIPNEFLGNVKSQININTKNCKYRQFKLMGS